VEPEQLLGLALVHRQRGGEHVRPGVRDPEDLEQALDAAVLAPPAVQRDERDIDPLLAQRDVDVAIDVDRHDVVATLPQRRQDGLAGPERHLTLAGQATQQHPDLARLHDCAHFLCSGPVPPGYTGETRSHRAVIPRSSLGLPAAPR
jgi:hypothetical protein